MTTDYEKRVLAATPQKALAFLRAASTKAEIRAALFAAGYSNAEQTLGWQLLQKASGYVPGVGSITDDGAARKAIAELDAWDEPGFARVGAALKRLHPEQYAFVFAGLEPARGAGAVLSVATLLDRLDQLSAAPERKAARKADGAALATLESRGITAELRAQLRELIKTAQSAATPELALDPSAEERDAAMVELRAWYEDWSQTARAVITRKDYLVMLGLSRRRRSSGEVEEVGDAELPDATAADGTATASPVAASDESSAAA